MQKKTSNFIFSLMLVSSWQIMAQEVVRKDSVRRVFAPTGIRIGLDAIGIIKTFSRDDFKGWELQADMDLRNYYVAVEAGHWQRDVVLENGNYTNNGNYFRIGADVNFLKKDPEKNMFFIGFRIGHSKYDEKLTYTHTTIEFGPQNETLENTNLKANWLELTTGLKVKILKSFWMGYTGRIKLFPSFSDSQQLQTYDIPGYGLTFKKPWWGFNYYLMFRVPMQKKE